MRMECPNTDPLAVGNAEDYLIYFYRRIGWNEQDTLDPKKIVMNEQQWQEVAAALNSLPRGPGEIAAGFAWMNWGPSADKRVPYGKIDVREGAFTRDHYDLSEEDKAAIDRAALSRFDVEGSVIRLHADYRDTNEGLLQSAYDAQEMGTDGFLRVIRDEINDNWADPFDFAIDDIIEHSGAVPSAGAADERYDLARDYIIENYSFEPPYSHYLDQKVNVNVLLATETEKNLDFASITEMEAGFMNPNLLDGEEQDNALAWLVDQQGYSIDDLKSAVLEYDDLGYETCQEAHGTFLASVASELFDFGSVQGAVTVLATISLNDMAKLLDPQAELVMPKDTTIGIFAPWVGGGSTLDIQLEKPLSIPHDLRFDIQIEGAACRGYTVNNVYGLVSEAWKQPLDTASPSVEREKPIDALMKEAKGKAAEKNALHQAAGKDYKPPEFER